MASTLYLEVRPEDAPAYSWAGAAGPPVARLHCPTDQPFFARQQRIVLENAGVIDPDSFKGYVAVGGYAPLVQALIDYDQRRCCGRSPSAACAVAAGAATLPASSGPRWPRCPESRKFVICNADEGTPGPSWTGRCWNPTPSGPGGHGHRGSCHRRRQGASAHVRAEYPLAVECLTTAIRKAKRAGFRRQDRRNPLQLRGAPGAPVPSSTGEETALMASIEGNRGQLRRAPYPAESGLWGCPTLINNVETFANIALSFATAVPGLPASAQRSPKGTKVFALAGTIENTGSIEVPMGTWTPRHHHGHWRRHPRGFSLQGGTDRRPLWRLHPRGTPGYPGEDGLKTLGTIMGSGGMIVMDETADMVDVARYFMEFCMSESCGKCVPCRAGTQQLHALLDKIAKGEARHQDLFCWKNCARSSKRPAFSSLGQTAPNPVLSTLRFFRDEYEAKLCAP